MQWSRNKGGGGGGGGGGNASPSQYQCTTNELVLYIVHTIAYYIAQYNPNSSKTNTAYCTYIHYFATHIFFWPCPYFYYLLITLSLWMEFQSNKLNGFKYYVRFLKQLTEVHKLLNCIQQFRLQQPLPSANF